MSWWGVGHYLFLPWQLLPPHPGKISRAGVCLLGSADSFQDWEIFADSSLAQQPPRVCVCVCVRSHGTTGFCVPVFRFLALFFGTLAPLSYGPRSLSVLQRCAAVWVCTWHSLSGSCSPTDEDEPTVKVKPASLTPHRPRASRDSAG